MKKHIIKIEGVSTSSTNGSIGKFKNEVKHFYAQNQTDLTTLNIFDFIEDMLELDIGLDLMFGFM